MDLNGAVAVVTGGNGGLGTCISRAFARAGAHVVVVYLERHEHARGVAEEVSALGPKAVAMAADVTDEEAIGSLVQTVMEQFGRIDVLVNNAGFNKWVPFPDLDQMTPDLWRHILNYNVTGPFLCTRAVAHIMRAQRRGRIINVASVAGLFPGGSSMAYATSKAALIHLTRCMAVALAPHVLVNSVAPGLMMGTRMTANLDPQYVERAKASVLIQAPVAKEDVADQVVAFARTDSITGQCVAIDGGRVFY